MTKATPAFLGLISLFLCGAAARASVVSVCEEFKNDKDKYSACLQKEVDRIVHSPSAAAAAPDLTTEDQFVGPLWLFPKFKPNDAKKFIEGFRKGNGDKAAALAASYKKDLDSPDPFRIVLFPPVAPEEYNKPAVRILVYNAEQKAFVRAGDDFDLNDLPEFMGRLSTLEKMKSLFSTRTLWKPNADNGKAFYEYGVMTALYAHLIRKKMKTLPAGKN